MSAFSRTNWGGKTHPEQRSCYPRAWHFGLNKKKPGSWAPVFISFYHLVADTRWSNLPDPGITSSVPWWAVISQTVIQNKPFPLKVAFCQVFLSQQHGLTSFCSFIQMLLGRSLANSGASSLSIPDIERNLVSTPAAKCCHGRKFLWLSCF